MTSREDTGNNVLWRHSREVFVELSVVMVLLSIWRALGCGFVVGHVLGPKFGSGIVRHMGFGLALGIGLGLALVLVLGPVLGLVLLLILC